MDGEAESNWKKVEADILMCLLSFSKQRTPLFFREKKSPDSEDTGPFFTEGHPKGFLQAGPMPLSC